MMVVLHNKTWQQQIVFCIYTFIFFICIKNQIIVEASSIGVMPCLMQRLHPIRIEKSAFPRGVHDLAHVYFFLKSELRKFVGEFLFCIGT